MKLFYTILMWTCISLFVMAIAGLLVVQHIRLSMVTYYKDGLISYPWSPVDAWGILGLELALIFFISAVIAYNCRGGPGELESYL